MKKVIFLLAMLTAVIKAEAQIQFGGKIGSNFSTHYGYGTEADYDESKPFLKGLNIGGVALIPLGESGAVQCEFGYSGKGVKYKDNDYYYKFKIRLNYLEFPIMYRHNLGSEGLHGFIIAGPYFSYAVNGKYRNIFEDYEDSEKVELSYDLQRGDIGINLGGGIQLNDNFGIDLRLGLGFSDIDTDDYKEYQPHNLNISIGAYYLIKK